MELERRHGKRYNARFGIVTNDTAGLNFSFITNLSRSGAFLSTHNPFAIGSPIKVYLSNGNYQAPIDGRVVRIQRHHGDQGETGLGIIFDQLSPIARRVRDDLLLYLMSLKYHQSWS